MWGAGEGLIWAYYGGGALGDCTRKFNWPSMQNGNARFTTVLTWKAVNFDIFSIISFKQEKRKSLLQIKMNSLNKNTSNL